MQTHKPPVVILLFIILTLIHYIQRDCCLKVKAEGTEEYNRKYVTDPNP